MVLLYSSSQDNRKMSADTKASKELTDLRQLSKWVPLRLSSTERRLLTVLEQTLNVSEYTDHVDITVRQVELKTRRIIEHLNEALYISTGLASGQEKELRELCTTNNDQSIIESKNTANQNTKNGNSANNNNKGNTNRPQSWAAKEPKDNAEFFQTLFEIGRRNKVLNPSSMRTTYGKMMYILQDSQNPTIAKSMGFSLYKDMLLVEDFLKDNGCEALLSDDRLLMATIYIHDRDRNGKRIHRDQVQHAVVAKRNAAKQLAKAYAKKIGSANVKRVIESLADAVAYIESNVHPVECMLDYLEVFFNPDHHVHPFSLALRGESRGGFGSSYLKYGYSAYSSGSEGPTLSHSHGTQYTFVWQSLRLWSKVMRNMHRLWICADQDLLSTTQAYRLCNTGQGLNRVQQCPRVSKVMHHLLHQTQTEAGTSWVGLSVVHLGDRDVPNALIFIDKYTQIPRFLNPLVAFLEGLDDLCLDDHIHAYVVNQFGSIGDLRLTILCDYFKHGFDGSGDDGGSCIDGRLTSSWNWTARVAKKPYYNALMLSGFQGFDGGFS